MTRRRALITGIAGQDGSLLAELLLEEDYEIFGIAQADSENLDAVRDRIELVTADLLDQHSLAAALNDCGPDEVYNLASPSFVLKSWEQPVETASWALALASVLAFAAIDASSCPGAAASRRPRLQPVRLHPSASQDESSEQVSP